jgi:hypothetical protein
MSDEEQETRAVEEAADVAQQWSSVNLTGLKDTMDEQAEGIASFNEECKVSRTGLVTATRDFKEEVDKADVPEDFKAKWPSLLKCYREEVNGLTQRCVVL